MKPTDAPPDQLNVLIVTADDMGSSLPGFMNGRGGLTPNLDRLAARSHRFVNNRTVVPICQPAREAIMTGLLPHHSGATGFTAVDEGIPTLVTILQDHGYFAGAIHKIDHMEPASCFPWDFAKEGKDRDTGIQAEGLRTIIRAARGEGKAFFANCNIDDPHRPFYGSQASRRIDDDLNGPYGIDVEILPEDVEIPAFLEDIPETRIEIAQYCNSVKRLDVSLGLIVQALGEEGAIDDCIILFCSDHGMPFPFAKSTCYDGGTRVPAIISWPGMGTPRVFENLTTNVDLLPTILDILSIPLQRECDGHSWLPLIAGVSADPEFVVTYVNTVASGRSYPMRAIQDARYSLVFSAFADGAFTVNLESMRSPGFRAMEELAQDDPEMATRVAQLRFGIPLAFYDLAEDPGQRVNRIDEPTHLARVERMKRVLLDEMRRTGDPQLANFETFLAGGKPVVEQNAKSFRSTRRQQRAIRRASFG